jgi:fumarylpyruvate hydrolase
MLHAGTQKPPGKDIVRGDKMSNYVFQPPAQASLPIRGSEQRFPVRRVYCVGRNYAAHAIEMGHDPEREDPFFFQKNPDNLLCGGEDFPYPVKSSDVHHEIEMIVALQRRDLQAACKKAGRPWEIGKAFDHSAPASELVAASEAGHPANGAIWLKVNGEIRQQGDLNQMIWKVPEMISYLSGLFELAAGDIILSGTPAGVGPVERGDRLEGYIDGVGKLHCQVV